MSLITYLRYWAHYFSQVRCISDDVDMTAWVIGSLEITGGIDTLGLTSLSNDFEPWKKVRARKKECGSEWNKNDWRRKICNTFSFCLLLEYEFTFTHFRSFAWKQTISLTLKHYFEKLVATRRPCVSTNPISFSPVLPCHIMLIWSANRIGLS